MFCGIDRAGYFGATGYFGDGDSCPFYSGPMLSGMSNLKTPSCVFWPLFFWGRLEKVFYFGLMSKSQGLSTKRLQAGYFVVSTELGIFRAAWFFLGGMEIVFHFIVVPCCPMSQKPRDVDKKTPSWVFCCVDRAGYFLGQLGILG